MEGKKFKNVNVQLQTRKARRAYARYNMKRQGLTQLNKKDPITKVSFFSQNWRAYSASEIYG